MGNDLTSASAAGAVSGSTIPRESAQQFFSAYFQGHPIDVGVMKGFTLEIDNFKTLRDVYEHFSGKIDLLRFYFGMNTDANQLSLLVVPVINGQEDYTFIQCVPISDPAQKQGDRKSPRLNSSH